MVSGPFLNDPLPTVVHVVVGEGISGIHRGLGTLGPRKDLTGINHVVVLFAPDIRSTKYLQASGLTVLNPGPVAETGLNYFRRSFGERDVRWLAETLNREKAICVHPHTFGSYTLSIRAARRYGIPVVRTIHGFGLKEHWSSKTLQRWTLRNSDALTAVSEYCANAAIAVEPSVGAKMRVIRTGIELDSYPPTSPPEGVPFSFAMTSRLVKLKQVDFAIKAIARVPEARLKIAGDGPELNRLRALTAKLGLESRVTFYGFLPDTRPLLAECHAALSCSSTEGLSRALIEAAAMQRPAVAFPIGGIPEVVQHERTGWLTNGCSIEALAAAMNSAASDRPRAAAMGVNARALVAERFGFDRMCREYGEVYRKISAAKHK